ncbi:MAG TPA: hypothetical protein VEQ60_26005 [Longimicrobium sp.]|nr:hypothetical protein [Longimicrobium sp.]
MSADSAVALRAASSLQAEPVYDPEQARPVEPEMRAMEPERVRPAELRMEAVQPQPRVEAMEPLPRPQPVQVPPSQPGGL